MTVTWCDAIIRDHNLQLFVCKFLTEIYCQKGCERSYNNNLRKTKRQATCMACRWIGTETQCQHANNTNKAQNTTHAQNNAESGCIISHFRTRKVWILSFSINKSSKLKEIIFAQQPLKIYSNRVWMNWKSLPRSICIHKTIEFHYFILTMCVCVYVCWLQKKAHN